MQQYDTLRETDGMGKPKVVDEERHPHATILDTIDAASCRGVHPGLLLESLSATSNRCCPVAYSSTRRRRWWL